MKTIQLTQGKVALVDDADYAELSKYKWCAWRIGGNWYSKRGIGTRKSFTQVYMHRVIMGALPGQQVDHINGDGLDNRRCNLRIATMAQNQANRRKSPGTSSAYKGVTLDTKKGGWIAYIKVRQKRIHLGHFADEVDAARAYDAAALKYFGEFARPNFNPVTLPGQMSLI